MKSIKNGNEKGLFFSFLFVFTLNVKRWTQQQTSEFSLIQNEREKKKRNLFDSSKYVFLLIGWLSHEIECKFKQIKITKFIKYKSNILLKEIQKIKSI